MVSFHPIFDAILPAVCIHCESRLGRPDDIVCPSCRKRLDACRRTRVRSVAGAGDATSRTKVLSLWIYAAGSPVRTMHRGLKYGGRRDIGSMAGREMGRLARSHLTGVGRKSIVIPVPSHPIRIAERGYNHAELLARGVSAELRIGLEPNALCRVRLSTSQSSIARSERMANVHGAFTVSDPAIVAERPVILVDDLFTTGATLAETASLIRAAGASFLTALTMAIRIVR